MFGFYMPYIDRYEVRIFNFRKFPMQAPNPADTSAGNLVTIGNIYQTYFHQIMYKLKVIILWGDIGIRLMISNWEAQYLLKRRGRALE